MVFETVVYWGDWALADYGGSMALTNIDRSAPTVTMTASDITADGFTISATSSVACDRWDYSLDNGTNWTNFSTTSGTSASYSVTGVEPNTTYNVKVRARKVSNEVYGSSATTAVDVLGGTLLQSVNTVTADSSTVQVAFSVNIFNNTYTHKLVLKNGNTTLVTLNNISITNGVNTVNLSSSQRSSILNSIPSAKEFLGTFELYSYDNGVQVGNPSVVDNVIVQTTAANSSPTFPGFTYRDSNTTSTSITQDNQVIIQSISTLVISASAATAKNGASISSYSVIAGSTTASSTTTTINVGAIDDVGTNSTMAIVVTAIDSRGYTTSTTVNAPVVAYEPLSITTGSMHRVNDADDMVTADVEGRMTAIMTSDTANPNKNYISLVRYRYRRTDNSSWGSWTNVTSGVTYTDSSFQYSVNDLVELDSDYSFYVEFEVADVLSSDTIIFTIPQGIPLMSFRRNKVGINKSEPSVALDVNGTIMMNGLNIFSFVAALDGTDDLDNVDVPGIYTQSTAGNATVAHHYPVAKAGYLEVLANPNGTVLQRYTAFDCSCVYIRNLSNNAWSDWIELILYGTGKSLFLGIGHIHGVQWGHATVQGTDHWATVTFPEEFAHIPFVIAGYASTGQLLTGDWPALKCAYITTTGFDIAYGGSGTTQRLAQWIAFDIDTTA